MTRTLLLGAGTVFVTLVLGATAAQKPAPAVHAKLLETYCVTCHSEKARTGGLSLEHADLVDIPKSAETWEKVIRKVRAGMMPPPGMPRPNPAMLDSFAAYVES